MGRPLAVLLVEDREEYAALVESCLIDAGHNARPVRVDCEDAMRAALASRSFDVVLSDNSVTGFSCQSALTVLRTTHPDTPFIALADNVDEHAILTLLRAGAGDCVVRTSLARLPSAIEREIRQGEERRQRERLESQLQQARKMEAIGRLAGGVAHDFNNLLTVISGFAQLALLDDNPARAGLEQIMLAAERATSLIRQLLAFSREQPLEPRVFDVNHMVRDLVKMLRRLIGEDIEVRIHTPADALTVKADPGHIEQVLLNLAINARDAMPSGGRLTLSTASRHLDPGVAATEGLSEGDYCAISVTDSGAGIPAELLPHVFEPFFTARREGKSTGLSLSTAYGIARQSGGAIQAFSEYGEGTTMTILLPVHSGLPQSAPAPARALLPARSEIVLVVEDDDTVLQLVAHSLSAGGFRVLKSSSGEGAVELLHAQGPAGIDLLITDVVMPGISGPVLAVRAVELLPRLKVLFMSGYTEDVIRNYGVSRANMAFIQKPFAPSELVRKVRQLLDPAFCREPVA